ncbi:MAG: PIG-L deacetylase family protein [Xanthobacteraceae bacterium]
MSKVLVVAAHPDDETLGCGGTLLRHRAEGDVLHWLIATETTPEVGGTPERVAARDREIVAATSHFDFAGVHRLGFASARLDVVPRAQLVGAIASVIGLAMPETIYVPFRGDIHSDHAAVADACVAAAKRFRQMSVRRIRAYETLSETEFQVSPGIPPFQPNLFIDISPYLESKIAAMRIYVSEMGVSPFPRSEETIRALATTRGSTAGYFAAEAFMTLREFV